MGNSAHIDGVGYAPSLLLPFGVRRDRSGRVTTNAVGPDTKQIWEILTVAGENVPVDRSYCRGSIESGFVTEQVLAEIEQIPASPTAGPLPPPNDRVEQGLFRERKRWHLTHRISHMRARLGGDKTVSTSSDGLDAPVAEYRRSD